MASFDVQPFNFSTSTLQSNPWGAAIQRVLSTALAAVDPYEAVLRYLHRVGHRLQVGSQVYDLATIRRVVVIGAGKAAIPMAQAAAQVLSDRLTGGLVITKEGHAAGVDRIGAVLVAEASHPLPDERGVSHTRRLVSLLQDGGPDDLVVCLISGGGSALMLSPVEGVSLEDLQHLTSSLLACGASIQEINAIRKHLDQVKGGGLARLAAPASLVTLVLSDVVGDPLDVIASGPTVPDPTTFDEVCRIINRYSLWDRLPTAIRQYLQRGYRGDNPETPKPGDAVFDKVLNVIVGSNLQAAQAALSQASVEGWNTLLLTTYLQGEARQAGRWLAAIVRQLVASGQPIARPACLVVGGETTVTLTGDGLGGRNQELALSTVADLAGLPGVVLVTLATDGGDGPTDAAGAVVTGETLARARRLGLDPDAYLSSNDSYHFFAPLGDLLHPGPTRTNVNDLAFLFVF